MTIMLIVLVVLLCIGVFVVNDICPCCVVKYLVVNERKPSESYLVRVVARGFTKYTLYDKTDSAIEQCIEFWQKTHLNSLYTYTMKDSFYLPRNLAFSVSITDAKNEGEILNVNTGGGNKR